MIVTSFPKFERIADLIRLAREEDLGAEDVTSRLLIPEDAVGAGTLIQKEPGVTCGLPIVEMVCRCYDERLRVEPVTGAGVEYLEGRLNEAAQTPLLRVVGPLCSLLSAERVILNFLQHMSGVATLTNRFVRRVEGTRARIVDTRKTLPGFRLLDKYAVVAGGGQNHRMGLYDGLLVKDNHLAGIPLERLAGGLERIVQRSRSESAERMVEVEVDNLDQLRELLKVEGIDIILLDNMDCPTLAEAVRMRDGTDRRSRLLLEASGGVTLDAVRAVAETAVERIAVGAITHSAPALDIGMEVEA
jgi:nicotinate-nucleotide pyrophosphorylase (carboxylating)